MITSLSRLCLLGAFAFGGCPSAKAAPVALPPAASKPIDFTRDIRPIFTQHCVKCHGPEKPKAKFRVDERQSFLDGGESGEPAIAVGKSGESHLIKLVAEVEKGEVMPPKGPKLSAEQVGLLRAWIDQGGKWSGDDAGDTASAKPRKGDHWSLQPVKRAEPPAVKNSAWVRNPIDAFILAKLEAAGLSPSKEASAAVLARRAHLILTGLPPTPEESSEFGVRSSELESKSTAPTTRNSERRTPNSSAAFDRLLASPRYGERWARHWLDVVRFAETNGFETNTPRPTAWHYRDYVIKAFNDDKPYDLFIKEQLAGDAMPPGTAGDAGTGFLVGGPMDEVKSPDINLTLMQRSDELNDIVNTTSTTFLGLTVACARCHNHKFDPISQKDYFAFMAVFAGVNHGQRPIRGSEAPDKAEQVAVLRAKVDVARGELSKLAKLREPVNAKVNEDRLTPVNAKFVRFTALASNSGEPCIDELEIWSQVRDAQPAKNVALGGKPASSGNYQGDPKHRLEHVNDGKLGNSFSWISNTAAPGSWVQVELAEPVMIDRIVWGRDRTEQYTDRLAVRYRIEVSGDAQTPAAWTTVASSDDRAPYGASLSELASLQFAHLPEAEAQRAKKLAGEIAEWERQLSSLTAKPTAYIGTFSQPAPVKRLFRGDPLAPREVVEPNALEVLDSDLKLTSKTPEQQRRVALAGWIASKDNPLTARVMVNRIWQHHFGEGLVGTPSDLGKMGFKPTHPELLDWLADEFMKSGWSVKHMQRLIAQSSTWRQASAPREEALKVDADARLLWRFPPRRLEAEAIRDSMLFVSGTLNERMGGAGWNAFKANENYVRVYTPKDEFTGDDLRRMVYMYKVRMEHDATFGAFDCPDAGQPTAKRTKSTTAIQALALFNSSIVLQQADALAARLKKDAGGDVKAQVARAFELCFARSPEASEAAASTSFISGYGLPAFCRAMINANEFVYVE